MTILDEIFALKKKEKSVKSMKEFREKYFPKDAKMYPIQMFVSEEEEKMICRRRGYEPLKAIEKLNQTRRK